MQVVSAYKLRCWVFCTDQTGIQTDYIADRDLCRKYAQLRIDTDTSSPQLLDNRDRTAKLVALFSACMADKGWTVPDGKANVPAGAAPIASPATATAPAASATSTKTPVGAISAAGAVGAPLIMTEAEAETLAERRREKTYLSRQSECTFARHGAAYSTASAARAQACDLECAQKLKADPKGGTPAACPRN